jgi:hypothetical protein
MNKVFILLICFCSGCCSLFNTSPFGSCYKKKSYHHSKSNWQCDGEYIVATGKGSRRRSAIVRAWKKAMMKFLTNNVDTDYLETYESQVERLIDENWQSYTCGHWQYLKPHNIVYNWDYQEREITIRVRVKESKLLRDVKRL